MLNADAKTSLRAYIIKCLPQSPAVCYLFWVVATSVSRDFTQVLSASFRTADASCQESNLISKWLSGAFSSYVISQTQPCPAPLLPGTSGVPWCFLLSWRALDRWKTQGFVVVVIVAYVVLFWYQPSGSCWALEEQWLLRRSQSSIKRERSVCLVMMPHICFCGQGWSSKSPDPWVS